MSRRKKYAANAFNELWKTLESHTGKGNSLAVLIKMIEENDAEFNGLKDVFIHDMNKFLTHWFTLVFETNRINSKIRSKILSSLFIIVELLIVESFNCCFWDCPTVYRH